MAATELDEEMTQVREKLIRIRFVRMMRPKRTSAMWFGEILDIFVQNQITNCKPD